MVALRLRGVIFEKKGPYATTIERRFDVPWDEDCALDLFGDYAAPAKDKQQLWSCGLYKEGANRGNTGIECNTAALLDKDCADVGEMDAVCRALSAQGLAYAVYTSWSHLKPEKTPNDQPDKKGPFDCFRVVLPFSRDVTKEEYPAIVQGLFGYEVPLDPPRYAQEVLGCLVTLPSGRERAARPRGWDPVSSRPAQGYYLPAPHSIFELHQGKPLDVDAVLKRPQTPRPTFRTSRPHQAPTLQAVGALGAFQAALVRCDFGLGREGYAGWSRSVCPSCQDPSPSLTVRANGDGIDMHCHAGCKRREILDALGLEDSQLFDAPTELKMLLEEQLVRQAPTDAAVPVDEAVGRLESDLREALAAREATILKFAAGTGKSHASAKVIAEEVRAGYKVAYSTQEHAVAHETRIKLPADIRARSVHIHSPLIQVGDEPTCARKEELSEKVFEYGASLLGQICPRCPMRTSCGALTAARDRAKALPDASVIFVSHAGIRQVFSGDKGADLKLIVDEMPSAFASIEVSHDQLSRLADGEVLPSAENLPVYISQEIARAWLVGEQPGNIVFGTRNMGAALELLKEHSRIKLRDGAKPRAEERPMLKAADTVLRLAAIQLEGGHVGGLTAPADGLWAMIPDACHQALIDRQGVLLSATPLVQALPNFRVRECEVTDGAKVRRVMVLRGSRGSKALTQSFYDDEMGQRKIRDREGDEAWGIPWPAVDAALARAREEAQRHECKRVLFVTFKVLADALRASPERTGQDISVAHYGATRGKNDWMEGRPEECSVVYCLGAPRFNMRPTLQALGLSGEAADQAWVQYAAGELAQAEGRLRLPRRTKPCSVVIEGDVAPSSWHPDLVDEVLTEDCIETASGLLEGALLLRTAEEVRAAGVEMSVVHGVPLTDDVEKLRTLARPRMPEAIGLLSKMTAGRRKWLESNISWAPCE